MPTKMREWRAIDAVACPRCGAPKGQQCRFQSPAGRPACCTERRHAWNATKPKIDPEGVRPEETFRCEFCRKPKPFSEKVKPFGVDRPHCCRDCKGLAERLIIAAQAKRGGNTK